MFYDELLQACIDAINGYNPNIETPDSFLERFLKKVNKIIFYIFIIVNERSKRKNLYSTSIFWSFTLQRFFKSFHRIFIHIQACFY